MVDADTNKNGIMEINKMTTRKINGSAPGKESGAEVGEIIRRTPGGMLPWRAEVAGGSRRSGMTVRSSGSCRDNGHGGGM